MSPALSLSQGGHENRVNFKGAVPTQDDVNMKRNLILLMLYVPRNILLGPCCCLCFACVCALDYEFQDSRGLCAVPQPHHLQSATDVLWITDESRSRKRKKRPVSDKKVKFSCSVVSDCLRPHGL